MKFDILEDLKNHLELKSKRKNTANTYYVAAKKVLSSSHFNCIEEIRREVIEEEIKHLPNKNRVSAAKQSLRALKDLYPKFDMPSDAFFKDVLQTKSNRRLTRKNQLEFSTVLRKINALKNDKLKLAYRLAVVTGMRVSELSDLRKGDIEFRNDNRLIVHVRDGLCGRILYPPRALSSQMH